MMHINQKVCFICSRSLWTAQKVEAVPSSVFKNSFSPARKSPVSLPSKWHPCSSRFSLVKVSEGQDYTGFSPATVVWLWIHQFSKKQQKPMTTNRLHGNYKRARYILLYENCGLLIFISLIFSKYVYVIVNIYNSRTRRGGGLWFGPLGSGWELGLP